MPKVKLSESELRKIILASLHEADPAPGATAPAVDTDTPRISFSTIFVPTTVMRTEMKYLIDAQAALSRPLNTAVKAAAPPENTLSLKAMREAVAVSAATGQLQLTWDASAASSAAIYKAWLKLQIINTIADKNSAGRQFFHVGSTVYTTQALFMTAPITRYNALTKAKKVDVASPEFFGMLDDVAFVKKISTGTSAAATAQFVADDAAAAYIEEASLAPLLAAAFAEARAAVEAMKEVWEQFNTDFVEEFFCLPILLPNGVWTRASNTDDPRSTPWRISYGVYNIASQAVGVRGGIAALYRKLYTYSAAGPSVQFAGRQSAADPFRAAGLFRESLEVRKTLMTVSELRRVIQAAFDVKLDRSTRRDTVLEGTIADIAALAKDAVKATISGVKKLVGAGEALSALEKLAARSVASATTMAEIATIKKSLETFFESLGSSPAAAKASVNSFVAPANALPPIDELGFTQAVNKTDENDLYALIKQLLEKMSDGSPIERIIADLTASSAFSAGPIASLGQTKRATLLRMIRVAKTNDRFLGGINNTKTAFLSALVTRTQQTYLSTFTATNTIKLSSGADATRTLTYDTAQKTFLFSGYDAATETTRVRTPITNDNAKQIFGDDLVGPVIDLIEGFIPSTSGTRVTMLAAFKGFQDAHLAKAEDALIGMLSNPTRANITANRGAAITDASRFMTSLDSIPSESSSIARFTEEAQGAFGKFAINPQGQQFFKALTFVERNIIGGPVRGSARLVRSVLGGKGLLADIADAIATNGVYSYLLGYIAFTGLGLLNPGGKSTPSKEDSFLGQIVSVFSSGLNTSPVAPALLNLIIDVFGKAFDAALQSSDENIQALFTADVLLAAEDNLGTALTVFNRLVDVKAENFPDLLKSANETAAAVAQVAEIAAETITAVARALTTNQAATAAAATSEVVAGVVGVTELAEGTSSSANATWAGLEAARKSAHTMTLDAVKSAGAGLVGTPAGGLAALAADMTVNYGTIKAEDDMWLQIGTKLTQIATGRNLSVSMETWAALKIKSGAGIAPSAGLDFAAYLADQGATITADQTTIAIVNAEFNKLAAAFARANASSSALTP